MTAFVSIFSSNDFPNAHRNICNFYHVYTCKRRYLFSNYV